MELPVHKSNATQEEREKTLEFIAVQIRFLHLQEKEEVPLMKVKIRCGCHKLLPWWMMVKCLYCSVFYCPDCAEEHFGMRRQPLEEKYSGVKS
jgi:hypothetical protein